MQPGSSTTAISNGSDDPETRTRITQYEMAFRMQSSVPELVDISRNLHIFLTCTARDVQTPGTFAHKRSRCRRLVERGVRGGADPPSRLGPALGTCRWQLREPVPRHGSSHGRAVSSTSSSAACSTTRLVVWGASSAAPSIRKEPSRKTTTAGTTTRGTSACGWRGAGSRSGIVVGETDDFSYNVVERAGARQRPQRHDPPLAWGSTTSASPTSSRASINA